MRSQWTAIRKELTRRFGENQYASTVEVQPGTGLPHLNVVMVCPELAKVTAQKPSATKSWLAKKAQSNGFGSICSIERARNRRAITGYVVKVAGEIEDHARAHPVAEQDSDELRAEAVRAVNQKTIFFQHQPTARQRERMIGEVIKLSQLPVNAPEHFRRLRSSKGFLPKPFKRPGVTGKLVFGPLPTAAREQEK